MTEREPWLGHRDLCSTQWSDICDCDPDNPVNLAEQEERWRGEPRGWMTDEEPGSDGPAGGVS